MNAILANTLSADTNTREDATRKLETACQENFREYMITLAAELANESNSADVRNAAGLALKNAVTARESARQNEYSTRWLALDSDAKTKIQQDALMTLASPSQKAGHFAAQVVSALAAVELPQGHWQDLIGLLLGFVNQDNTKLRIATLQTIGFVCETVNPRILRLRSNEILTAVIQGARPEEPSQEVQLAAITALYNSLEFVRENFDREGERNYIMQVICEGTQHRSPEIQVGAWKCLVQIMALYYDKMGFYMEQALFGLSEMGMKNPDENVALQAVEFWSTVCQEEIDLAVEQQEAAEYGEQPESESKFFAKIALSGVVPVLLMLLTKQNEDPDDDEWNVALSAGHCLSLFASAVEDAIVPAVIPFVEAHIKSQDWRHREAAVTAFGSMLDGPEPTVLNPLVIQALPLLIGMMSDTNPHVKDTTTWTLGRICDLLIGEISSEVHLHPLVTALVNGLQDGPRVITNCCWALQNLADQLDSPEDDGLDALNADKLSPYYEGVVQALLRLTENANNEGNYRASAYEAISSYVTHAPKDNIHVVQNTLVTILQRMEHLLSLRNQILGTDDRNNWNELQTFCCTVIISAVRKLNDGIRPLADRIMTLLLQLIQAASKTSTVLEDAFLVVGAVASALEAGFAPYIQAFLPFLYPALKAHEDAHLCSVAVGLIGDISRALGEEAAQYAGSFMTVLLENLQSEVLNRNVKISILTCFGDIALAIGGAFEPFLETTMGVLRQAGALEPNPLDYELVEYVGQLREGILEAYAGIIAGFRGTNKTPLLLPYAPAMLELVERSLRNEDRTDSIINKCYGIIGDMAQVLPPGGELKQLLLSEWVASELRSKRRLPPDVKKTLRWAKDMVKRATA